MGTPSKKDILRIAQQAVPEHIRPLGQVVTPAPQVALAFVGRAGVKKDTLIADLAKHVRAKLPQDEGEAAVVEFPEQTALGLRTTVVHVKDGKVVRAFKRG